MTAPNVTPYAKRPVPPAPDAMPVYLGGELSALERSVASLTLTNLRAVTAAASVRLSGETLLVDATAGAVTVTLPIGRRYRGWRATVKKVDASLNAVTVNAGTATIDGAGTVALAAQWQSLSCQSDGVNWFIV